MNSSKLETLLKKVGRPVVQEHSNINELFAELLSMSVLRNIKGGKPIANTSCTGTNAECNNYLCFATTDGVCQNSAC